MIRNTKNEDDFYKMKGNKGDETKRSNTSKNNLKRCKSSEQISHNWNLIILCKLRREIKIMIDI